MPRNREMSQLLLPAADTQGWQQHTTHTSLPHSTVGAFRVYRILPRPAMESHRKNPHTFRSLVCALSLLSEPNKKLAHTNTQCSAYTHFNLLSHMPVTNARDTYCASATQNIHTRPRLGFSFSSPFAPQILSLSLLSPSLFLLTWC